MKLTEAIQIPLYESYKDLRSLLETEFENADPSDYEYIFDTFKVVNQDLDSIRDVERSVPSAKEISLLYNAYTPSREKAKAFVSLARFALQHPLSRGKSIDDLIRRAKNDASSGQRNFLELMVIYLRVVVQNLIEEIEERKDSKEKPKITKDTEGSGYVVYKLENYSAARELCNRYDTNFCIGSSDKSWFYRYDKEYGNTYAIIVSNNKAVILHTNDNGDDWLLTSHDNKSHVGAEEGDRGYGATSVIDDLNSGGMRFDRILELLSNYIDVSRHKELYNELSGRSNESSIIDEMDIGEVTVTIKTDNVALVDKEWIIEILSPVSKTVVPVSMTDDEGNVSIERSNASELQSILSDFYNFDSEKIERLGRYILNYANSNALETIAMMTQQAAARASEKEEAMNLFIDQNIDYLDID